MNGSFNITTSNQYITGVVSWYEYDINESTNKSKVHAELRLSRTNSGYETWSTTGGYNLSIDGQAFYGSATRDKVISYNSNTLMVSGDAEITHNDNGSKTITISVSGDTSNLDIDLQSGQAVLTTIPRKSSVFAGEGTIGSNLQITISRASNTFTHKLLYSFGSLTGVIAENIGESYPWEVPTSFYTQIPNNRAGTGIITCETYSGGTLIGSTQTQFTAKCNESQCKPNLNVGLADINEVTSTLTGSGNPNIVLVDYQSQAQLTLSYSAKNSSSIKSIQINNNTYNPSSQTSSVIVLNNTPFNEIRVIVTDTRDYSNEFLCQCFNEEIAGYYKRIEYVNLSINAITSRSSQIADDMFVKIDGNYFKGNFNDTTPNILALTWKVREKNGTWTNGATVLTPTISKTENKYSLANTELVNPLSEDGTWDYQKIYEFEFTATDKLLSVVSSDARPKGQPNFAIFKDDILLSSGKTLRQLLNAYKIFTSTVQTVGTESSKTSVNFSYSYGNTNDISLSGGKIAISNNIKTVKVSYIIRYDWDADIERFNSRLFCGDAHWLTHTLINHSINLVMTSCISNFVIDVTTNKTIDLQMWYGNAESQGNANSNADVYVIVEVIE